MQGAAAEGPSPARAGAGRPGRGRRWPDPATRSVGTPSYMVQEMDPAWLAGSGAEGAREGTMARVLRSATTGIHGGGAARNRGSETGGKRRERKEHGAGGGGSAWWSSLLLRRGRRRELVRELHPLELGTRKREAAWSGQLGPRSAREGPRMGWSGPAAEEAEREATWRLGSGQGRRMVVAGPIGVRQVLRWRWRAPKSKEKVGGDGG